MASTDAYAVFGWDDTRDTPPSLVLQGSAEPGFGLQDVYVAAVQHAPVKTGGSTTGPVVLASVLGLVAGMLIWLAVVVRRRAGEKRSVVGPRPARDVTPVGYRGVVARCSPLDG